MDKLLLMNMLTCILLWLVDPLHDKVSLSRHWLHINDNKPAIYLQMLLIQLDLQDFLDLMSKRLLQPKDYASYYSLH